MLGLQILSSMGIKHIEAFGDSLLVVQQIADTFQCLDGSLNAYLDKCLEIIALFNDFTIHHFSRDENTVVNDLLRKHPVSDQIEENSIFWKHRMFQFAKLYNLVFGRCAVRQYVMLDQIQQN
jgi:ribonuclease HI